MKTHKMSRWIVGPMALGLALSAVGVAQAQPGAGQPMGQNPPNWNQGGGGNRLNWRNMTPEQRAQMIAQRREQFIRQGLTQMGFTDTTMQDALVEFVATQATAVAPLQDKQNAIMQALQNKTTTDAQFATLMTDWQTLATAEQTRRTQALKDLDTSISYSKNPRLNALLTVFGIVGDQSSLSSPYGSAMMGGRGGMGGGRGGRGGRGGGNGGNNGGAAPAPGQ